MKPRRDSRALRSGYTTGACAAAAARAAAIALLRQEPVDSVRINLPDSKQASFRISWCIFNRSEASSSVIKDAGDDPDVTHGTEIQATVSWKNEPGVTVTGGKGVGIVTKPGLEIPVGMSAINPVPRQMIEHSVREAAGGKLNDKGMQITISVPAGEELAKRTLNPRIGIKNGISILGTTGIVVPYSIDAYTACISQGLDVAVACGCRQVVLTTGRRSEKFAQKELALPEECFIQAGDFIGYSLHECVKRLLDKVIVWGMTGKISKMAAGHLYTNISDSRVDIDFLVEIAAGCGIPDEKLDDLRAAVTANHLRRMLPPEYIREFCEQLCRLAAEKSRDECGGRLEVEYIMSDYDGTVLGRANAKG